MDDVGSHQKEITEIFAGKTSYLGEEPVFNFPLVLMCFTNRCGSNMLSEYLRQTGNFGGLFEHLNGFAVRTMVEATKAPTFPDHVSAIVDKHRKDAATFGFKASWDQLLMLLRWRIDRMFSSLHVIHMERVDLLAQAVSYSIADQTKKWTSTHTGNDIEPQYNASDISNRINGIGKGNLMIKKVCLTHDLDWIRLVYENVLATPIAELERIHKWLDLSLFKVNLRRARIRRQSDGINDEFIARYRAEAFATLGREPVRPAGEVRARASAGL